ncbi:hypothetical protein V5799_034442 [Amblyomma americanum]|uniref:alkaline phosphatase n=1 Tax=Amblyomma americanum TaxID=6943 RepID=A0AAQ4DKG5_AMBAM
MKPAYSSMVFHDYKISPNERDHRTGSRCISCSVIPFFGANVVEMTACPRGGRRVRAEDPEFWYRYNRKALERRLSTEKREGRAQNVILFIGDGMGISTITAARVFKGQLAGKTGETSALIFEKFPHASLSKFIAGGGREHFLVPEEAAQSGQPGRRPDSRNLIEEWSHLKQADRMSAHVCTTWKDIDDLDPARAETVLALLASGDLPYEDLDDIRQGRSRLAKLTEKAIQILSKNPDGFLLLVEAGQIDKGHHETLAQRSLAEVLSLDLAVSKAVQMTRPDETLIVVTADHGHTFVMGGKPHRGANIFGLDDKQVPRTVLNYAVGPGYHQDYSNLTLDATSNVDFAFPSVYGEKAGTHSGEDVAVFAYGPYAHLFSGVHEQTYIYEVIRYAAGLDESSRPLKRHSLLMLINIWLPDPVKYAFGLTILFYIYVFFKALM